MTNSLIHIISFTAGVAYPVWNNCEFDTKGYSYTPS